MDCIEFLFEFYQALCLQCYLFLVSFFLIIKDFFISFGCYFISFYLVFSRFVISLLNFYLCSLVLSLKLTILVILLSQISKPIFIPLISQFLPQSFYSQSHFCQFHQISNIKVIYFSILHSHLNIKLMNTSKLCYSIFEMIDLLFLFVMLGFEFMYFTHMG